MLDVLPSAQTVVYKTVKGNDEEEVQIPLDVYMPSTQSHDDPVPLIWIHTGGFLQGTRKMTPGHMLRSVNRHNLALIAPDFRLAPQADLSLILQDIHDCIHFVLSGKLNAASTSFRINTDRYVLAGSSAGGWSSLLLGLNLVPSLAVPTPAALISIYPITTVSESLAPYFHQQLRPLPWAYSATAKAGDVVPCEPLLEHMDRRAKVRTEASLALEPARSTLYSFSRQEGIYPQLTLRKDQDAAEYCTPSLIKRKNQQHPQTWPSVIFIAYGNADVMVETSQSRLVIDAIEQCAEAHLVTHVEESQGHLWDILQHNVEIPGMWEGVTQAIRGHSI